MNLFLIKMFEAIRKTQIMSSYLIIIQMNDVKVVLEWSQNQGNRIKVDILINFDNILKMCNVSEQVNRQKRDKSNVKITLLNTKSYGRVLEKP